MDYSLTSMQGMILRNADSTFIQEGVNGWEEYQTWLAQGNAPGPYKPQSWDANGNPI